MSLNKNQKKYNKAIMASGLKSNEYINENLGLIQKYVTDYAGRTDYWADKLSNKQLDLLQDTYLAQNAAMLRGSAAFGSNSETNRQIENNAYDQSNYLANVQNQNIELANQLQSNELSALGNATELNLQNRGEGLTAAQNVDAINNSWLSAIGKGMQSVGNAGIASGIPWAQAVGAGLSMAGGTIEGLTSPNTTGSEIGKQSYNYGAQMKKGISDWQASRKTRSIAESAPTSYSTYSGTNSGNLSNTGLLTNVDTSRMKFSWQ